MDPSSVVCSAVTVVEMWEEREIREETTVVYIYIYIFMRARGWNKRRRMMHIVCAMMHHPSIRIHIHSPQYKNSTHARSISIPISFPIVIASVIAAMSINAVPPTSINLVDESSSSAVVVVVVEI